MRSHRGFAWLAAASTALGCRSERSPATEAPPKMAAAPPDSQTALRFEERRALFAKVFEEAAIQDARVRDALLAVPRHRFVPEGQRSSAYQDRPLDIGHGQTISQPAVVAVMTAAVAPKPTDHCLEIGTGSGYQAAVLAELCDRVFSIEVVKALGHFAEANLREAGYGPDRVALRIGDGYGGWPDAGPFQVIVVTAAPERVPKPLLDQLAVGGRLIVPVGGRDEVQSLDLIERLAPGDAPDALSRRSLMAVRFVPFVREPAPR